MSKLKDILALPEGVRRTAALVAWVQGIYGVDDPKPILVGGAAVELYTGGAYTTGDLDFVGSVPAAVAKALAEAGFERRGRHWIHDPGRIFLEFPAAGLDPGEESITLEVEGERIVVVEPEALVADRLAAWQVWESPQDGVNAWLIARGRSLDFQRIEALAGVRGVSAAAAKLAEIVERWQERDPTEEELEQWARDIPDG